ncbi:MAG: DUF1259 domain-containing protein [Candidatus Sumerlaeia bacterium]|nr:DUF1259 domain-containing protein [Candidatus Sumerlaeia bacterium]
MRTLFLLVLCATLLALAGRAPALDPAERERIAKAIALPPAPAEEDGSLLFLWRRPDEALITAGVALPPYINLRSSFRFRGEPGAAEFEGTLIVRGDELEQVQGQAERAGLAPEASELYFFVSPKVFTLRLAGAGDAGRLAKEVRALLDRIADLRAIRDGDPAALGASAEDPEDPLAQAVAKGRFRTACNCFMHVMGRAFQVVDDSAEVRERAPERLGYGAQRDAALAGMTGGATGPPDYVAGLAAMAPASWRARSAAAAVLAESGSRLVTGLFAPRLLRRTAARP